MKTLACTFAYLVSGALLVWSIGQEWSMVQWNSKPTLFQRALCAICWPAIVFKVLLRWRE